MEKGIVKKFIPVNKYDAQGIIAWLNAMAHEGLILKKIGIFFAIFERKPSEKVKYILLAQNNKTTSLEVISQLEQQSWRQVGQIGSGYTVYCIINSNEEHGELQEKAKISSAPVVKRLIWSNVLSPLLPIIIFTLMNIILMQQYSDIPWMFLSDEVIEIKMLFGALVIFLCGLNAINIYYITRFSKLNLDLDAASSRWRKIKSLKIVGYLISTILVIGVLGSCVFMECTEYKKSIDKWQLGSSVLRLSKIEENNGYRANNLQNNGEDMSNVVEYTPTILTSAKYNINQYGHVLQATEGNSTRILRMKSMEVRSNFLTKLIFNKELKQKNKQCQTSFKELEKKGKFEKLMYGEIDKGQYLLGYKGKKIIFVTYEGEEDIQQYMDDIYKMMEAI